MTPGRKPSRSTSDSSTSRAKISRPAPVLRSSVMLRLLRARKGIPRPKGSRGAVTTSTSMPRSASSVEQKGPGSWRERSSIRKRPSGGAVMCPALTRARAARARVPRDQGAQRHGDAHAAGAAGVRRSAVDQALPEVAHPDGGAPVEPGEPDGDAGERRLAVDEWARADERDLDRGAGGRRQHGEHESQPGAVPEQPRDEEQRRQEDGAKQGTAADEAAGRVREDEERHAAGD